MFNYHIHHVEDIRHVCLLGLGAGNLHTEIYSKFPDVHIDTVEINPEVIEVAHKEFNLPKSKRLRIIQGDVHDYINEVHNYDLVIVDVYDADGQVMLDNRWLKKQGIGSNGYRGGWRVSYYDIMPENHQYRHCQSLDIKEVACDAFSKVLEEQYGLNVISESRAD